MGSVGGVGWEGGGEASGVRVWGARVGPRGGRGEGEGGVGGMGRGKETGRVSEREVRGGPRGGV